MSINLLDMLKDQVSGQLAKQAGDFLGESESNVQSALGGAFPAILGSMIGKSSEPAGAKGLMDMIGGVDSNMLSNIGGLFGGGASSVNGLLNSGGGIIEALLGDKFGGVADIISKVSGLKSGSSSSLLKMAAPFLIGMIGKQMKGKGLSFLTDMLLGQKDSVAKALPAGMGSLLGLGFADGGNVVSNIADSAKSAASDVSNVARDTASAATSVASEAASTGMGWIKWAFPLLLIGGLAWWFLGKGGADTVKGGMENVAAGAKDLGDKAADATKTMADKAGDAAAGMADAVSDLAQSAFAKVDEAAKAALDKVTFGANSAGEQMMAFINGGFKGDGKVTFNNLTFTTGSAEMDASSASEVDNLAAILKAYPDVKINVSGYTDNTGDAAKNKTLSSARAAAVQGRLIAQGIASNRISAKGMGDADPVASNDTEEGRAQNRRIEVTIAK